MIAIGTDILKLARVEEVVGRLGQKFVDRILTPREREEYASSSRPENLLAKRFAAKEAIAKALGTGIGRGVSWQDIEIYHDDNGAPLARLDGGALQVAQSLGGSRVAISLADEEDCVIAFAVLDK